MTQSFHAYTRKEIISWVQKKQTKYKYEDLKNGVFFCKMLVSKFPQQSAALKYNPNPISQYDCINNINLVKKTLNKHGLQLNMNIQVVVSSKNNFELAKWFKNNIETAQDNLIRNYSSVPIPRQSITSFRQSQSKKNFEETPKKVLFQRQVKKKMESAQKQPNNSLSKVKRLSMAKSEAAFFKEKKNMMKTDLKIPINKNDKKFEEPIQKRMYQTTQKIQRSEQFSDGDDINEILYQRALEESIESLTRIMNKVKECANNCQVKDYNEYRKTIKLAIYSR